jgi:acyl-CoA hydrolase
MQKVLDIACEAEMKSVAKQDHGRPRKRLREETEDEEEAEIVDNSSSLLEGEEVRYVACRM